MRPKERLLLAVFAQVRTCFNQLKALTEQLHEDLGVSPSMRAVMEALAARGQQTVPDIAKGKRVSRQHIQTIMNSLQAEGLVDPFDNPAHRRSPRFDLTSKGRRVFAKIEEREKEPLRRLALASSSESLEEVQDALIVLNQKLASEISKGSSDGKSR
jgi:DNA-binding MarR family transcriptional regulator